MSNGVLDLAKIELGERELQMEKFDLLEVLGESISKELCELLGGMIQAENQPNKGTQVTLQFSRFEPTNAAQPVGQQPDVKTPQILA